MVNVEGLGPIEVDEPMTQEEAQAVQAEAASKVQPVQASKVTKQTLVPPTPKTIEGEETLTTFQHKIDQAKLAGLGFVETTEAIFNYYTGGSNPTEFFWYQNVKVFKYGTREAIEAFDNLPLEERARHMMQREANKPK